MRYDQEILSVLKQKRHQRVEDIFHALKHAYPLVSVATVYRNLKRLSEQGNVASLLHPDGSARYELRDERTHQHLVCESCGTIIEIKFGFVEELSINLKEKAGFHLHEHRLAMVGRCSGCI